MNTAIAAFASAAPRDRERHASRPRRGELFLICGDSGLSPSETSPRRWRAPASGMRARARVRSAEAPRPADPATDLLRQAPRDSADFALRFPARFQENLGPD